MWTAHTHVIQVPPQLLCFWSSGPAESKLSVIWVIITGWKGGFTKQHLRTELLIFHLLWKMSLKHKRPDWINEAIIPQFQFMKDSGTQVEAFCIISAKLICPIYCRGSWIYPQRLVQQNLRLWGKSIQVLQCFSIWEIHFLPSEIHLWSDFKKFQTPTVFVCLFVSPICIQQPHIAKNHHEGLKRRNSSISGMFPRCGLGLTNNWNVGCLSQAAQGSTLLTPSGTVSDFKRKSSLISSWSQ